MRRFCLAAWLWRLQGLKPYPFGILYAALKRRSSTVLRDLAEVRHGTAKFFDF
jgi:hypothetical protein